jgi:protein-disulfide isomerase
VFSNFECSHCREFYLRTIKKVLKDYSSADKVCVIYHDFPFSSHKYDRKAARYAEAASRVGLNTVLKVFDAFYTEQATWSQNGKLEEILQKALTSEEYRKVLEYSEDPEIDTLIEKQYQLATDKGLQSTPTSYIFYPGKEQKVEGVITYVVLKGFIDKIIK